MNLQITSDNMQVTPSMQSLAESKLEKLLRLWDHMQEDEKSVRIVMNTAPDEGFLVKIEAVARGDKFYTQELGFQLETALIEAIEELIRQYKKEKSNESDWEEIRENKTLSEEDLENMLEMGE